MENQLLELFVGGIMNAIRQQPFVFALLFLAFIIGTLSRLPSVKGWFGELVMRIAFKLFLPKETYRVINNVTIADNQGGTTQIDHVVISPYGLFVVETKHYKGWIFGGEKDSQWTQTIYRHKTKFQNPLRQNYKHTACLQSLLGLTQEQIKSVIVFTGECTLKTKDKLPAHVTYPRTCVGYIRNHREQVFTGEEVAAISATIQENRLTPSWKTHRQHVQYVKELQSEDDVKPFQGAAPAIGEDKEQQRCADSEKICPQCGSAMLLRTAKRGSSAGNQFWGCSNYPRCRQIIQM